MQPSNIPVCVVQLDGNSFPRPPVYVAIPQQQPQPLVLNRADRDLDLLPQAHPFAQLERQAVLPPHDLFDGRLQLVLALSLIHI